MKSILPAVAAMLACAIPSAAKADPADIDRWHAAMDSARWTGPLLASTPETLPQGHFYTEPYFFDVIAGGEHHPGTSGYYQYGLFDSFTVGFQPDFAYGTQRTNRGTAIGDFKLLSQLRVTHFAPEHQIPSIGIVLQEVLPTGKYDRLGPGKDGHGSGSFATEIGVNVQQYFLLENGRLLRARFNFLERFPHGADVHDRSVYGTDFGFRGHASPGRKTTLIGAVEYSLTNEWVLAFDVEAEFAGKTKVRGRDVPGGPLLRTTIPASSEVSFAPAVEYNWDAKTGAILGVWVIPKGHNTPSSVTPAIAISRFW